LKNSDVYYLYPTCSLVYHAVSLAVKAAPFPFGGGIEGGGIEGQVLNCEFGRVLPVARN